MNGGKSHYNVQNKKICFFEDRRKWIEKVYTLTTVNWIHDGVTHKPVIIVNIKRNSAYPKCRIPFGPPVVRLV